MQIKRKMTYLLLLLTFLFLTACNTANSAETGVEYRKKETRRESNQNIKEMVMVMNLDGASTSVYVDNTWFNRNRFIGGLLFQGLLIAEGDMNNVQPDLCSEFSVSQDGLTYVFRLKDHLYWHDGNRLTMEDITWSIETCLKAQNVNGYLKKVLERIVGAKAYEAGDSEEISGMKIEGDYLILQISQSDDSFLSGLAQLAILPKHCFEGVSPSDMEHSEFWKSPIGSGPYKIREVKEGREILFEVNEEYSGNIPKIKRIRCLLMEDLQEDSFDFAMTSDPAVIKKYREDPDYEAVKTNNLYYRYLVFNVDGRSGESGEFLKNRKIRQALYMGLDRKGIIEELYQGSAIPIHTGIEQGSAWYAEGSTGQLEFDQERAREILQEEGFNFEEPIVLTRYNQDALSVELLERIAKNWEELGIKVEIQPLEPTDTNRLWVEVDWYNVSLKNLAAVDYSEWYYEYSSNNQLWSGILKNRTEFDQLVNSLNRSGWAFERKEIYRQLQELELEHVYKIPLAIVPQYIVYNSKNLDIPEIDFPNLWYYFDIRIEDWNFRE